MLSILGTTWGLLTGFRASLYETGWLPCHNLELPVISIGALSVGGAGKTPTTALIASLLSEAGVQPAILSRGYRRKSTAALLVSHGDGRGPVVAVDQAGDEPFWLASVLPTVPVVVAKRREEAAHVALAAAAVTPDVFLLDDGFQHLRVARNANLLIVNPEEPFWEDTPIPSGRLREAPTAATRADGFLIVGDDTDATMGLHNHFPEHPWFELTRQTPCYWSLGQEIPRAWPTNENKSATETRLKGSVFAFAGIARPERFFEDLEADGVTLKGQCTFPDHHEFRAQDVTRVIKMAQKCGADTLVTTEKDAVRLPSKKFRLPLRVWGYRLQTSSPETLVSWLKELTGLSSIPDAA
ncbi:MAG: tetraacyldisaccharide 4'-kinase [Acidobacteriota bacterium]|jgi:tetraacyldisaccharide 4'-kinase|nr:tetraacyldisaccharide 4'-kinase [Acidobacteriota bacterium]